MLPFRLFFQRKRMLRTEMLFISVLTGKSELRKWATDFGSGSTLEREASLESVNSKGRMHMRKQNI